MEPKPPVDSRSPSSPDRTPDKAGDDPGPALCLSGGGFRATLFHLGALIRLNELGVLSGMKVISSVSGGSILNGVLATRWADLTRGDGGVFTDFEIVADAIRDFCSRDLRTGLLILARVNPRYAPFVISNLGAVPADALVKPYDGIMRDMRLDQLPDPRGGGTRFIFCATNLLTGACWHFHGGPHGRMGDFYTGYFDADGVSVSQAVAASSAFPPGFGGLRLSPSSSPDRIDPWGRRRVASPKAEHMARPETAGHVLLTDGGVYDNLGVEPVWDLCRTLIVSDAGHPFSSTQNVWQAFISRLVRVADISAEQVGAVRKRWLIERIRTGGWLDGLRGKVSDLPSLPGQPAAKDGTIWAIDTPPENFPKPPEHSYGLAERGLLASIRTDLNAFSEGEQGCLQNHGYWLADSGIRQYALGLAGKPDAEFRWPCPDWAPGKGTIEAALASSAKRRVLNDIVRWAFRRDGRTPRAAP